MRSAGLPTVEGKGMRIRSPQVICCCCGSFLLKFKESDNRARMRNDFGAQKTLKTLRLRHEARRRPRRSVSTLARGWRLTCRGHGLRGNPWDLLDARSEDAVERASGFERDRLQFGLRLLLVPTRSEAGWVAHSAPAAAAAGSSVPWVTMTTRVKLAGSLRALAFRSDLLRLTPDTKPVSTLWGSWGRGRTTAPDDPWGLR